jgi:hypothetical protein
MILSLPGLTRQSRKGTQCLSKRDGRVKPGHDDELEFTILNAACP